MAKPTFRDRWTISGDLIPPSRLPGIGGGAFRCGYETGDTFTADGVYPAGCRMRGMNEDVESAKDNRGLWQTFLNADLLFGTEPAIPLAELFVAGGGGDAEKIINYPVFLGNLGFAPADIIQIMALKTPTYNPLYEAEVEVYASDMQTQALGAGVSMYPAAGLPPVTTVPALVNAVAGQNITLQGVGIVGAAISWSLFNYSQWMRGIRDDNLVTIFGAFATIEAVNVAATDFDVHRNIQALGWVADDEIYVTHFGYAPYVVFNTTISAAVNYRIGFGFNLPGGRIGKDVNQVCQLHQNKGTTQSLDKIINIALAEPDANWDFFANPSRWETTTAGAGPADVIVIPVLVPHHSTLKNAILYYQHSGAVTNDATMILYKEDWAGARTLLATVTFDTAGVPDPAITFGAITEVVDLETYEYYLEISSGFDAINVIVHTLSGARILFEYEDNHLLCT